MDENSLQVGAIYFGVGYEDDESLSRPILSTFEYLGEEERRPSTHIFKYLGTGDLLELKDSQLDYVLDFEGLKEVLGDWYQRIQVNRSE
ncbi:hypothetical protein [Dechloromonas denitrificans]|uniref:hypothetical protein n=1 Tax=Dechloromonas denitrificans TaxID=281362 RepID=UPI001CF891F9|nr:hypothetical protein [Dechloromonas denitrificans]UCV03886.1 hypothetical protein KI611_00995 [Dechloromonas denitrificans]